MYSYTPLEPKMCFSTPYKYMHTDRHTHENDTIYTFLIWSYNPYTQNVVHIWLDYLHYVV